MNKNITNTLELSANRDDLVLAYTPRFSNQNIIHPFVDPATIAAAIEAAMSMIEKRNFANWQSDVSGKLDEISRKLDEIIAELKKMRLWMDERITEEARRTFHSSIDAKRKGVEDILKIAPNGKLTPEQKTRLKDKYLDQIKEVTDQLANWPYYGFAHYDGVLSGITMVILLYRLTQTDLNEAKTYARRMIDDFLTEAINPANPKSLETGRNQIAQEVIRQTNVLNSLLDKWWMTNCNLVIEPIVTLTPIDGPPASRSYIWISMRPTGNVSSGFTKTSRSLEGRRTEDPWYPNLPEHYDMGDGAGKAWYYLNQDLERHRSEILDTMALESRMKDYIKQVVTIIARLELFISTKETPIKQVKTTVTKDAKN